MGTTTSIAIEMGILTFLGILYYLFQRRRIIRNDLTDIYQLNEKLIYHINDYIDDKRNESIYTVLNAYAEKLESLNEAGDIYALCDFYREVPSVLPEELRADIEIIKKQLSFHEGN